jgi:hypothetical protein
MGFWRIIYGAAGLKAPDVWEDLPKWLVIAAGPSSAEEAARLIVSIFHNEALQEAVVAVSKLGGTRAVEQFVRSLAQETEYVKP